MRSVISSAERLFRLYYKHNIEPDLDTLYHLLNSIHNLNDMFKKNLDDDFFDSDEFVALKVIRNLFHHQADVQNEFRIIPVEDFSFLITDLMYVCLIRVSSISEAIEKMPKKFKEEEIGAISKVFHFYNNVVNINPCIFNFIVQVYEKLLHHNITLTTEDFNEFKHSYDYETENFISHYIDGKFLCMPEDIKKLEKTVFKDII